MTTARVVELDLSGRTALVTGAGSGIGRACAIRLAAAGAAVIAVDIDERAAKEVAAAIGGRAVPADLADPAAVDQLPAEVDVLVNNAGLALGLEPAQSASLDDWDTMVDTNVKGLIYCTRVALEGMVARNRGHIVNISSVAAQFPYAGGHVYSASKAFVHQFGLSVRADLLGTRVRLTEIQPGMTGGTEFSNVRFKGDAAKAAKIYEDLETLTSEDVADSVHWAVTRPAHVNINSIQMMPVTQAPSRLALHRKQAKQ